MEERKLDWEIINQLYPVENDAWIEEDRNKYIIRQSLPIHFVAELSMDSGLHFKKDLEGSYGIGFGIYDKNGEYVGRVWVDKTRNPANYYLPLYHKGNPEKD